MKASRACPLFALSLVMMLALGLCAFFLPQREVSDMENRTLTQFSAPTASSLLSGRWMRQTETALNDQFPLRDNWILLNAGWGTALLRNERNGILLGKHRRLFAQPWYSQEEMQNIEENVAAMDALAEAFGLPAQVLLVPTSAYVYQEDLPAFAPRTDEAALLSRLSECLSRARLVRVDQVLRNGVVAGMLSYYYRTDHHWTRLAARQAYTLVAQDYPGPPYKGALGTRFADDFYGSYYARAPGPLLRPDTLDYYSLSGLRLTIDGREMPGLVDEAQLKRRDKYAALCWGNQGALTLTNDRVAEGTLLVIRDSYANALLPLLATHFHRVEVVDPRYFTGDLLSYIREKEASHILCLYGLSTLRTDRSLLLRTADLGQ